MSDAADPDQKTEAPTPKRRRDAAEKGDVLQSRELGTALVVLVGAAWLAFAGPMMVDACSAMVTDALTFDAAEIRQFDPGMAALRLLGIVALPFLGLFALTIVAAVGTPAALGSLGFRSGAFAFKGNKLDPIAGMKRIFGVQGLIELGKSIAKVALLGTVGAWLLMSQTRGMIGLTSQDIRPALGDVGNTFVIAVLVMAFALALIAMIDVPAQMFQRLKRLRMTKQETKEETSRPRAPPRSRRRSDAASTRRRATPRAGRSPRRPWC